MWIQYRDELGIVSCEVEDTISFIDGYAYFTVLYGKDMKVKMEAIMEIGRCTE